MLAFVSERVAVGRQCGCRDCDIASADFIAYYEKRMAASVVYNAFGKKRSRKLLSIGVVILFSFSDEEYRRSSDGRAGNDEVIGGNAVRNLAVPGVVV